MPGRWRFGPATVLACAASLAAGPVLAHGSAPPDPTLGIVVSTWLPDPLPWIVAGSAVIAYVAAVLRVNAAHPANPVPGWRVGAWLTGVTLGLVALVSAVDTYAESLLWVHMVQHLILSMMVPPLLALGAPLTLTLRASSATTRQRAILPVLHSRAVRVVASPFVAWPLFAAVLLASHFTSLYDAALENDALHVVEHGLFLLSGILFWWPVVAADPGPRRMSYLGRTAYLLLQMPVAAAVGLVIYFSPTLLYAHYATNDRAWGPSAMIDQQVGGLVMWTAGNLVQLVAVAVLVGAWMQADVRRTERTELRRAAVPEGAERQRPG